MTIIFAMKKCDINTNESTIKTAAPRGALRAFYNYVSVDAMSSVQYNDRGLCGRCSHSIRRILRIAPSCELHSRRADSEDPEEQSTSGYDFSDFRFHIYHL